MCEQYSRLCRIWQTYELYKLERERYSIARKSNQRFLAVDLARSATYLCQFTLLNKR